MRLSIISLCTIFAVLFAFSCAEQQTEYSKEHSLYSLVDSASYAIGFQSGSRLESLGFPDVNVDAYLAGFLTAIESEENAIADTELRSMFTKFNEYIRDKIVSENQIEADAFFAENRTLDGVMETASGLQYRIIRDAEGEKPLAQNSVVVMYEGRLIDGTIFDSTYGDGQPAEFVLGQVIPGWIEGIQLMPVGSEFEFYIPAELAYGNNPRAGGEIQPGDALIFKVELLEIK